jgi:LacI family transcriptional regulator
LTWATSRAAQLLDSLIKGEPRPEGPRYIPPTKRIVRQSTDVFAVDDPIVTVALRFISEHSHKAIRVDDVAKRAAVSRRSLERKFQAVIERPISDEITRLRLERVKRRLIESDDSIKTLVPVRFSTVRYSRRSKSLTALTLGVE